MNVWKRVEQVQGTLEPEFCRDFYMLLLLQICFYVCYAGDFMKSLSRGQADIIEAFSSTSRHLDD